MSVERPELPSGEVIGAAARRVVVFAALTVGAVGLAALTLRQSGVDAGRLTELLARARLPPLLGALVIMTGGMWFMALRWRALMPGARGASAAALTAIECAGLLLNYALPGPVGELAMAWMVHRRYGVTVPGALAAGVCSRVIGLSMAGILALLAWSLGDMPVPEDYQGLIGGAAISIALGALVLAAFAASPELLRWTTARSVGRLAGRPGRIGTWTTRISAGIDAVAAALQSLRALGARAWAEAALWALCGHLSVAGGIAIAAGAMGVEAPFGGVLFTYSAATAGVVMVFALPGGQVGWDAMFCSFFLVTTGTSLVDALAVTLVVRLQQLLLLLGGAAALPMLSPLSGSPSPAPPPRRP